jgi:transcription-repair coupling factor (superfamily II helicase)
MFPRLNIAVGHGQMSEGDLEKVMTDFVAGRHEILVCTTIIESGLDIPNCNTLIIEGADRFGLAQLYQLRGRVGRFKRQAYAYLLLHRDTTLRDEARKRLASIRQFNQLGAGFRIAMRDLELRGAGNLLGTEQSGHIAGIGFDLYCQLLRQSIASLRGEKTATRIRASLKLDFVNFGKNNEANSASSQTDFQALKESRLEGTRVDPIQAVLPETYISEPQLRITFYRRLATTSDLDALHEIAEDLQDRFKKYPTEVKALLLTTEIRCLAEARGIMRVETQGNRLLLRLSKGSTDEYIRSGKRFPRLTSKQALSRLKEIVQYIKRIKP